MMTKMIMMMMIMMMRAVSDCVFRWNGVHLLISPAASHSGWEDHFQSDQYHYLHHRSVLYSKYLKVRTVL